MESNEPRPKSGEGIRIPLRSIRATHYTLDKAGTQTCIDKRPPTPQLGDVDYREILLGKGTHLPPEDATAPKRGPREPTGSVGTRPVTVYSTVVERRDPNTSETRDTLGAYSMGHAFHTAEEPRSRSLGRTSSHWPMIMRQSGAASQDVPQPKFDRCACGGSCPRCQAKSTLEVEPADDAYEREGDTVADRVMRMAGGEGPIIPAVSGLQRTCAACEMEDEELLVRTKAEPSSASTQGDAATVPSSVVTALESPGQALDFNTRAFFEPRFGHDFSAVRVHTDAAAARSARDVSALAYTVGHDIVFGTGWLAPGTHEGRRLLAHELTHVVQQQRAPAHVALQRKDEKESQPKERLVQTPQKTCEDALDITEVFRGFMKTYPNAIDEMQGLTEEQRKGHKAMLRMVLEKEGGVDVMKWKALSCKKINLDLRIGNESFNAYFDSANKTVGLSEEYVSKLTLALKDKDALLDIIRVLAHEKRHATLGSSVSVPQSALKGEPSESKAQNAAYRAEEILATAEEIAVTRMAWGSAYEVEESYQRKFNRLRNMIRNGSLKTSSRGSGSSSSTSFVRGTDSMMAATTRSPSA